MCALSWTLERPDAAGERGFAVWFWLPSRSGAMLPQPAPWIRDTRRSQGIHARPARLLSLRTHAATPDTQRTRDSRSRAADPDMGIRPTLDV